MTSHRQMYFIKKLMLPGQLCTQGHIYHQIVVSTIINLLSHFDSCLLLIGCESRL